MNYRAGVMMSMLLCMSLLVGISSAPSAWAQDSNPSSTENGAFEVQEYKEGDEITFLRFGPKQLFTNDMMKGLELEFLFNGTTTLLEVAQRWDNNVHHDSFWENADTKYQFAKKEDIQAATKSLLNLLTSNTPSIPWTYKDLFTQEKSDLPNATEELKKEIWDQFDILDKAGMDLPFRSNDKSTASNTIDALLDPKQGNFGTKDVGSMVDYLKGAWSLNKTQITALRKGFAEKVLLARLPDSLVQISQLEEGKSTTKIVIMAGPESDCSGYSCCCRQRGGRCENAATQYYCIRILGDHCNNGISIKCETLG